MIKAKTAYTNSADDWDTDPHFINDIQENEARWGSKNVDGSGRMESIDLGELRENVIKSHEEIKLIQSKDMPQASYGYGGKFGVEKDRMDQSAAGIDYVAQVPKHPSQTDYVKGFGGKYGLNEGSMDKSALAWDHKEAIDPHCSQKDYSYGYGGKFGKHEGRSGTQTTGGSEDPAPSRSQRASPKVSPQTEEAAQIVYDLKAAKNMFERKIVEQGKATRPESYDRTVPKANGHSIGNVRDHKEGGTAQSKGVGVVGGRSTLRPISPDQHRALESGRVSLASDGTRAALSNGNCQPTDSGSEECVKVKDRIKSFQNGSVQPHHNNGPRPAAQKKSWPPTTPAKETVGKFVPTPIESKVDDSSSKDTQFVSQPIVCNGNGARFETEPGSGPTIVTSPATPVPTVDDEWEDGDAAGITHTNGDHFDVEQICQADHVSPQKVIHDPFPTPLSLSQGVGTVGHATPEPQVKRSPIVSQPDAVTSAPLSPAGNAPSPPTVPNHLTPSAHSLEPLHGEVEESAIYQNLDEVSAPLTLPLDGDVPSETPSDHAPQIGDREAGDGSAEIGDRSRLLSLPDQLREMGIDHRQLGTVAIAMYDYQAGEEDELTFDPGELITHINMVDEGWWTGICRRKEGLFPANYVQLMDTGTV